MRYHSPEGEINPLCDNQKRVSSVDIDHMQCLKNSIKFVSNISIILSGKHLMTTRDFATVGLIKSYRIYDYETSKVVTLKY